MTVALQSHHVSGVYVSCLGASITTRAGTRSFPTYRPDIRCLGSTSFLTDSRKMSHFVAHISFASLPGWKQFTHLTSRAKCSGKLFFERIRIALKSCIDHRISLANKNITERGVFTRTRKKKTIKHGKFSNVSDFPFCTDTNVRLIRLNCV